MENNQKIGNIKNSNVINSNNYLEDTKKISNEEYSNTKANSCSILALSISIISLIFSVFALFPSIPRLLNNDNLQFDYIGLIIGILSIFVTVLIGWNIYQLIDFRDKKEQVNELKVKMTKELNYIHNKTDYNQALMYSMVSQSEAIKFSPDGAIINKFLMMCKGLTALKIFSNLPDCDIEIEKLSKTLVKGLENSSSTILKENMITQLLLMCGEIKNKDKINDFETIIEYLNKKA